MDELCGGAINLEHRYEIVKNLGSYGFVGSYYGIQDPFEIPILLETFHFPTNEEAVEIANTLVDSVSLWAQLHHPRIERLVDVNFLESSLPFVISTLHFGIRLSSLISSVGPLSVQEAHRLFGDLANALCYAHHHEIYHGNLSSEWIFIDGESISDATITHWCISLTTKQLSSLGLLTPFETRSYAPERLKGSKETNASYPSEKGDVFSLAVVVYEMLTGIHPFVDFESDSSRVEMTIEDLSAERSEKVIQPLTEFGIEEEISSVVLKGLQSSPEGRWSDVVSFYEAFSDACGITPHPITPYPADHYYSKDEYRDPRRCGEHAKDPLHLKTNTGPHLHYDMEKESILDGTETSHGESRHDDWEAYPSPKGRAFAIALMLLLITNIGWYLYVSTKESQPETPFSTAELVRIESTPSGASLTEILPNGEPHPVGETPMTVNLKEYARRQIRGTLTKEGYKDMEVVISSDGKETILLRVDLAEE